MPKRTLYVKAEDEPIWKTAEKLLEENPRLNSLSSVVTTALQREVERIERDKSIPGEMQYITATYFDRKEGLFHRVAFYGKWLIQDHLIGNYYHSIAITEKQQFFVLVKFADGIGNYEVCRDFEDLKEFDYKWGEIDEYILTRVANYLGEEHVVYLDI